MRRPVARPVLPLVALSLTTLLIAACGERARQPALIDAAPLVSDSAGVRIVNDTAPSWGGTARWTIGATPTIDLGEPENQFGGLGPLVRLSDGHLVVLSQASGEVRVVEATPAAYREKAMLPVLARGARSDAPPSFADGRLFVRSDEEVVALSIGR